MSAEAGPPGLLFPASARILRRGDFVRVQERGTKVHTPHFVILVLPSAETRAPERRAGQRLGITVGRRVGGAVRRNRVKRLVREVFRKNRELFPPDCDVVLVARPGAERLDYAAVKLEVERAQQALRRPPKASRTSKRPAPARDP